MNLIIFDIDGTLTQTNEMDSACFAKAIEDVLQINNLNTDWAFYQYSTDSGLLKEIYASFLKREPSAQEVEFIQERFVTYLQAAWTANCSSITAVPGAQKDSRLTKLFIFHQDVLIKIEPNEILRSTVFPCKNRDLS